MRRRTIFLTAINASISPGWRLKNPNHLYRRVRLTGYRRHPQLFTLPLRSNLALVTLTVPQSHLTSYCGTRSGARRFRHWYS